MSLSTTLRLLNRCFEAITAGTHEVTEEGAVMFAQGLRKALTEAEDLEAACAQLEAERPPGDAAFEDLWDAKCRGKVVVIPTHRALLAHGLAVLADRRFGEDEGGAA